MDFLLFPGGIIGMCVVLCLYLRKQQTAQRAIRIAKAHLTPVEDISAGFAAVEASVKLLRAAKNEENDLHISQWEKQFYTPDEYHKVLDERRHGKMLDKGTITSKVTTAKSISGAQIRMQPAFVDDGPEWLPLPSRRHKEPEELSYSQRRIQRAGAFVRSAPSTSASVYGVAEGGSVMRFDGYVHGDPVGGNDVWFVYIGKNSKLPKFVHSIATTNRTTVGMPDLTEYDTETIMNGAGEIVSTIKTRPTGGVVLTSEYLQLPNATIKSRQAENLNPDQIAELERQPAIVKNYQDDRATQGRPVV